MTDGWKNEDQILKGQERLQRDRTMTGRDVGERERERERDTHTHTQIVR